MNKKIIYSLVGLALIFFIGSLMVFLKSNNETKPVKPGASPKSGAVVESKELDTMDVKIFFLTEDSRYMVPLRYEMEDVANKQILFKTFVDLLLQGGSSESHITPVPSGVKLRSLYFIENKELLVLDFSDQLIGNFPPGTTREMEFIYFVVNNICYNFREIKKVKFMVSGNEYKILSGHIDMANPFFPDYRYFKDE
ncbi:MAG: GerMN domain-containing protein [bacterium]|nr:GerMN domain-containing protein [bacterium]